MNEYVCLDADPRVARLFEPLRLQRGPTLRNRLVLAPLTNTQSCADGTLSDDEYRWLAMRAEGGFGMAMTCAAHVQAVGQGYQGSSAPLATSICRASRGSLVV